LHQLWRIFSANANYPVRPKKSFLNQEKLKTAAVIITCLLFCFTTKAQQWKLYYDSAAQAEKSRQFQQAQMYYAHAEENLPQDSVNTLTAVAISKGSGEASLRLGNYTNASIKLEQALQVSEQNGFTTQPLYAIVCERLARVYEQTAPEKAESFYLKATELNNKLFTDNSAEYAASCNSLGNYYYNSAQYTKSITIHLLAKKIRAGILGTNHAEYARSCNNIGAVYLAMGEYEKAEAPVLEAKKIRAGLPPVNAHPDYAISCTNLANIYRDMGQYEKAEQLYTEAKNIRADIEPLLLHPDYAASCNILADLYAQTDKTEKAELLYKEAMLIREKNNGNQSLAYAESCNNLAALYSGMKRYTAAENFALTAKNIWDNKTPPENPNHAINRNSLGELYFKMGNYEKSLAYFSEAGNTWKKQLGEKHPYYTGNLYSHARLYNAMKKPVEADSFYKRTLAEQTEQASRIFRFTSEKEKEAYLQRTSNIADEYFSFCINNPQQADAGILYNHMLLKRGLILSSLLQVRRAVYNSSDTALIKRYEAWLNMKKQLAVLYSSLSANTEKINKLEEETNSIEKWLAQQSAAFSKAQQTINWKQVKKQLGENDAAIEFVSFRYYNGKEFTDSIVYAALVLKKNYPLPILIPLFEKKQLDSIIGESNNVTAVNKLYSRGTKGIKVLRNTRPLYDIVWKPLEKVLENVTKVFYTPAGQLFRVSFAALVMDKQKMLSDKIVLLQCNSTASAGSNNVTLTTKDKLCLFGGIEYNTDTNLLKKNISVYKNNTGNTQSLLFKSTYRYSFLPGTLTEVTDIKNKAGLFTIGATVITGSNATEQSFKSISNNKSPSILHIATHGFFNDAAKDSSSSWTKKINPLLKSGLLFAGAQHSINGNQLPGNEDGIATALEISDMQLTATKLVVLSACETALGDIQGDEGVYGLQRAFRMAGAGKLVMSLWEVPDKETIQQSFLLTQAAMKNKYRKSPEKWAAWVLVR
jgi:CHAT domain-containing protein/tetratricopeptide (TPR) repeat protein